MGIGWNFPSNNNSEIVGIGEAGIETFRGSLFSSLAREICQNSLDARVDVNKPVRVEFSLENIKTTNVPGFADLHAALKLCRNFWAENKKTVDFFDNAIKVCAANNIRMLRISDFNTTGLTGSNKLKSSPWQDLVKSSGVSNKGGESGGSFGIGKSAPFACSDLRTIFYSTLDINGLKAYQGVSKLVSFQYPDKKGFLNTTKGEITQGKGYYGENSDNSAVKNLLKLGCFRRKEVGTDVYVLGFVNKREWSDEVIKSVIENYLISFYQNDLEVVVDNVKVNRNTIPELIEKYKDDVPLTYNYYQILTSKDATVIKEDFCGLGNFELHILIQKDFRRKILMARNNGMKIFDMKNISGTIPFAGICILKDKSLNEYFREMENPQHNNWEPDRHSNQREAKKRKKELSQLIKAKVLEVGKTTVLDEMDAVGAGEFIPDIDVIKGNSDNSNDRETINNDVRDFTPIEKSSSIKANKGTQKVLESSISTDDTDIGILDTESEIFADSIPLGEDGTEKSAKNKSDSEKSPDDLYTGISGDEGDAIIRKPDSIQPLKLRLFLRDKLNKEYKLSFKPDISATDTFIEVSVSGEQANTPVVVKSAKLSSGEMLVHNKNRIYIGNVTAGENYVVVYSIKYSEICSMEVVLNGYKI